MRYLLKPKEQYGLNLTCASSHCDAHHRSAVVVALVLFLRQAVLVVLFLVHVAALHTQGHERTVATLIVAYRRGVCRRRRL